MRLYYKKLNSVEALKREKIRLRFQRRQTSTSDFIPLREKKRGKKDGKDTGNALGFIMELIGSESWAQTALSVGKPLLKLIGKKKSKNSWLKKGAMELLKGYLLGKSVQMGWYGIQIFLRSRKNKKRKKEEYAAKNW